MLYLCIKIYHRATYYYQVIGKNINNKFCCLRLFVVVYKLVIHVHNGINAWSKCNGHRCYSYGAKTPPYYNVYLEVITSCFHGNQTRYKKFNMSLHVPSLNPTHVQSFRLVLFTVYEIQGFKLNYNNNNNNKQKNWENELFVISLLLVMQFLPYFRYTCMLPIATILR